VAEPDPGAIFGEGGAFTGEPRSATVRTLQECVLLEVERLAKLMNDRRAHLRDLSREKKEDQVNELVEEMLQVFSSLTGGESRDRG
jgi:CRP-like cAMP-binding protein